ncbi:MAG TPA: 16S rRNA (guanine(527)-N(7))-methyltransferase RsmG [Thermotogota bacterium]|nr:16S rRNA (guanine(527)-N(7))-methyltransferase RsmG [Thermotogota bacterium]HPJ89608.1 16S rRNA (guanine(527)-N(7))-methyltransferase RsmG [Thermotogota bacterium]HPR96791.1 16S rRNA (guanine(527)-N(7))-methyltransferase RsmG [Thermotogota bacterium]
MQKREELFEQFMDIIEEENKKQNLIRFGNRKELFIRHIKDSVAPFDTEKLKALTGKVLDIGSGGGFPAIPLAIRFEQTEFHLVESEKRKADYLLRSAERLRLENVFVYNLRVEDFSKAHREAFDFCTMRAVASTAMSLEYAVPSLKTGGSIYLYKGPNFENELEEAKNAMNTLNVEYRFSVHYPYDFEGESFNPLLAVFKKTASTPSKFPRRPGMAKKRPL